LVCPATALIILLTDANLSGEQGAAVVRAATGIVVVDEAYGAFHHDSFLPWAGEVENLIVMRTISKIGFAGLRMGYAAASPSIIGELAKITQIIAQEGANVVKLAHNQFKNLSRFRDIEVQVTVETNGLAHIEKLTQAFREKNYEITLTI